MAIENRSWKSFTRIIFFLQDYFFPMVYHPYIERYKKIFITQFKKKKIKNLRNICFIILFFCFKILWKKKIFFLIKHCEISLSNQLILLSISKFNFLLVKIRHNYLNSNYKKISQCSSADIYLFFFCFFKFLCQKTKCYCHLTINFILICLDVANIKLNW